MAIRDSDFLVTMDGLMAELGCELLAPVTALVGLVELLLLLLTLPDVLFDTFGAAVLLSCWISLCLWLLPLELSLLVGEIRLLCIKLRGLDMLCELELLCTGAGGFPEGRNTK